MAGETHFSHLLSRWYGKHGHLIGFTKGREVTTVSVNPPSIAAGDTGYVDVTVAGVKPSRWHRVVMIPPDDLEAGLEVTTTAIQTADTVRVSFLNTSAAPIDGAARDWSAHVFKACL